jgi:predicted nucleotidyltransferase
LIGIHNPQFSDIDVIVYGAEASRKLKEAIIKLINMDGSINPLSRLEREERCRDRVGKFPLDFHELLRISETWWNYGYFEGTYFSAHPTRTDKEITEIYGDNSYHRIGDVTGIATISDDSESMFLPANYKIDMVEGNSTIQIERLISFEVLYCGVFKRGDVVEFHGALEEIKGKSSGYQVVIGGAGSPNGYIKWSSHSV